MISLSKYSPSLIPKVVVLNTLPKHSKIFAIDFLGPLMKFPFNNIPRISIPPSVSSSPLKVMSIP